MQTITHSIPNIHPIFDDFDRVYSQLSIKEDQQSLLKPRYDKAFRELFNTFSNYAGVEYSVDYINKSYEPLHAILDRDKTILVCVSGGKDSVATVLNYLNKGWHPIMYHLTGINYTYKDEYKAVEQVAAYLKVPCVIEELKLSGKQEWVEHPAKNMIIANAALQYGLRNEITTRLGFGNFLSSSLLDEPFDICGGDCIEMWHIYEHIIRRTLPRFRIYLSLYSMADTIDLLLKDPELISYTQSCIGPYRYREKLRKHNQEKYSISLMDHRCGSCWKCCLEYCILCDKGICEYNEEYYKHCLGILQTTLSKEQEYPCNIYDTWNHYFFYGLTESKYPVNSLVFN